jgi:hypothetical protein
MRIRIRNIGLNHPSITSPSECWDNNVVVQLAERAWMRAYRVGTSLRDLRERVYTVGRSDIRLNDHQDSEVSHIPYLPVLKQPLERLTVCLFQMLRIRSG